MNQYEKFLVFATIICPFTVLRIGFIGIGEILILFLFLFNLKKLDITSEYVFSRFWFVFLLCLFLGHLYHLFILDYTYGTLDTASFDIAAYFMILISCLTIEGLVNRNKVDIYKILRYVFLYLSTILVCLYFLSLFWDTIAGMPLRYYGHFAPLVNNLHQISMIISPLIFLGILIYFREKDWLIKILCIFFCLLLIKMAFETGSFKAYLGVLGGLCFFIAFRILRLLNKKVCFILFFTIAIIGIIYFLNEYEFIIKYFLNIFQEEDVADGRSNLYSIAINTLKASPVLGFGPGPHLYYDADFWDAHQTILSLLLQSGIVGGCLFLFSSVYYIKTIRQNYLILSATIPILVYMLGGDILRRLPIWLLLIFFYYLVKQDLFKRENTEL